MAQIIAFPNTPDRDWLDLEAMLREQYKTMPDGIGTLEDSLPEIKNLWGQIFISFDVKPHITVPGPLTNEQQNAIFAAVEAAVRLVGERLVADRSRCFGLLAAKVWESNYYRRNGSPT